MARQHPCHEEVLGSLWCNKPQGYMAGTAYEAEELAVLCR